MFISIFITRYINLGKPKLCVMEKTTISKILQNTVKKKYEDNKNIIKKNKKI